MRHHFVKFIALLTVVIFLSIFYSVWISFQKINQKNEQENTRWGNELAKVEQVMALFDGVHDPLNDIFISNDIESEMRRFERYKIEYTEQFYGLIQDIQNSAVIGKDEIKNQEVKKIVENITEINSYYFKNAESLFLSLNTKDIRKTMSWYSKTTNQHQLVHDNFLELKNSLFTKHMDEIEKLSILKVQKINELSYLSVFLLLMFVVIFFIFSKLINRIHEQSAKLEDQLKELNILKFAVDKFLIISKADLSGNITFVNKLFEEISGYSLNEVLGKNHRVLKSEEHSQVFYQELWSDILSGKIWRGQIKNKKKNGEYYWVDSCILPIRNSGGVIEEFISIRSEITKQKELESRLLEKNIFYQSLVSNMNEGLVVQDLNGKIIICNERASEILERPMNTLLEKSSADPDWYAIKLDGAPYLPEEHPSMVVLGGNVPHATGVMGLRFKNKIKWIEINSVPILTEDKKMLYSLTTFFDVTVKTNQMNLSLAIIQLKEAFLRHKYNLKEFYNFLNFSIHNVFKADLIFMTKMVESLGGYKLFPRNALFEFFEDDNYVNYELMLSNQLVFSLGELENIATRCDQRDLTIYNYSEYVNFFPFLNAFDKKFERFSIIILFKNNRPHTLFFLGFNADNFELDVNVNKLSYLQTLDQMMSSALDEEYLREEKDKLQFTLESSGVYFININLSTKKVKFDDSFKKKFQLANEGDEIDLEIFMESLRQRDAGNSQIDELIDDIFVKRESFERRVYLRRTNSANEVYLIKGRMNKDNEQYNYYCTIIDESKNASLELEIQKQKDLVYQNQKLAAIGELAAGVGHEINNPLTIISGYVQKLRRLSATNATVDSFEECFKNMDKSIHRIKNIVTGLRKFSHKNSLEVEVVDLVVCISDVVEMVRDIYLVDGVIVLFNFNSSCFQIVGNYGKIQQVVLNLMNNARDALKDVNSVDKKIEISLTLNKNKILLEIQDNGPGIDESVIDKIFNAFYTTKQVGEGTGLGLSIVHNIIKEHNASIVVSSELNKFTKFVITFDQYNKNDSSVDVSSQVEVTKVEGNEDIKHVLAGKNLLIVEDESSIRDIIKDILEDYSMTIVEVDNGLQAIEQIAQNQYDIVLTDMKMPIMTGQELLERVREFETLDLSRFIIMSGGVNLVLENLKDEFGFSDILSKPFSDQDLVLKIYLTLKKLQRKSE